MYIHCLCSHKKKSDALGPELKTVVNLHVSVRNQTLSSGRTAMFLAAEASLQSKKYIDITGIETELSDKYL